MRTYIADTSEIISAENTIALTVDEISKSYGATVAVEAASFLLVAGQVHALLGENGAGKSTLVKILSGVVKPNSGRMVLNDLSYAPHSIMAARAGGVTTAFQELSLLPNLSVAENFFLPHLPRGISGMISDTATRKLGGEILEQYGLSHINSSTRVDKLSLEDRQRIEIVRAMKNGSSVLILDEPTAALSETEWLFDHVRNVTAKGMAVLYISHRLSEVRTLCNRATILRNGRSIGVIQLDDSTDDDIFEMMVGRKVQTSFDVTFNVDTESPPVLSVSRISKNNLKDVSFDLRPGEILGIAALEGQGQRELFRVLAGLEQPDSGTISVNGQHVFIHGPNKALKIGGGIAYLPEERKTEGIFAGLTTASNIVLPILPRVAQCGLLSKNMEYKFSSFVADDVELNQKYLSFEMGNLSGGNQQKVLVARVLATGARTLLLFNPTRGVDVGTKQSIYAAIRKFAKEGGSILFYSSELSEISQLAQRCLVIYGGEVFAEFTGDDIEEKNLVGALIGHLVDNKPLPAAQQGC